MSLGIGYTDKSEWEVYRDIGLIFFVGYPKWTVKTRVAYDIGRENNAFLEKGHCPCRGRSGIL